MSKEQPKHGRPRSLVVSVGDQFGLLTVEDIFLGRGGQKHFHCRCKCGELIVTRAWNLRNGARGCRSCSRIRHGLSHTRTHRAWTNMKLRCYDTDHKNFSDYGGRGIVVCDRWRNSFDNFFADMGLCPEGMMLDRIENELGYEPGNCRWADYKTQQRNRRSNARLTFNGENLCIVEWAEKIGISQYTISMRLRRGWSVEKTLTEPVITPRKTP